MNLNRFCEIVLGNLEYDESEEKELQINYLAMSLLLPEEVFINEYNKAKEQFKNSKQSIVDYLSNLFVVERGLVLIRIKLLKEEGKIDNLEMKKNKRSK